VAELADTLRVMTEQDVDKVDRPESLTGAVNAREYLLRLNGAVPLLDRFEAVVAVGAAIRGLLAEVT
jgi:hypothetical protein